MALHQTSEPKIVLDSFGFPCLKYASMRIGLLPVTKVQVEMILGRAGSPGSNFYDLCCAINPRGSWRNPNLASIETLFLTGIVAEEASSIASLYDSSCRLLTAEEWRQADQCLTKAIDPTVLSRLMTDRRVHPAARAIIRMTNQQAKTPTGRMIALFDGGVLEWVVNQEGKFGLFGRSPTRLYSILLEPQCHNPARPLTNERNAAFGFRLAYGGVNN